VTKIFVTVQLELEIYFESLTTFLPKCEFVHCVRDTRKPVASAGTAGCSAIAIVVMLVVRNTYILVSSASKFFIGRGGGGFAQIKFLQWISYLLLTTGGSSGGKIIVPFFPYIFCDAAPVRK